jgi:uncharacterized protein (DUF1499 family)
MNQTAPILAAVIVSGLVVSLLTGCAGERSRGPEVGDGRLTACPDRPNCVSSQATDERHRIAPLRFTGDGVAALARLRAILLQRRDCRIVAESPDYIRVELRTRLFTDDGEFLLDGSRSVIQVRSASRIGYSDLGKNRDRIEEIRAAFDK